jgi:putative flippase GtrA
MPPAFFRLLRFLAAGIPAFLIAIPLNFLLVENLAWPKSAAYALVLVVQVTINFFACIFFVFERDSSKNPASQFAVFMCGILAVRGLDWSLYSLLVKTTPIHYLVLQFANAAIFSLAKFAFARRTIEGGSRRSEVGGQKSEVGGQKSEVGAQKSEVGAQKSEVGAQKSEVGAQKSEVGAQKSEVGGQKSEVGEQG